MPGDRLEYDPHDPSLMTAGTPWGLLARLRSERPVSPTPTGSTYLSRRREVDELLADVEHFGSDMTTGTGIDGVESVPPDQLFLPEIDEPTHGEVRRLFNAALGPHRVGRIQPFVRECCDRLLDELVNEPQPVDLHVRYAMPIPSMVVAHVLGLPEGAWEDLAAWSNDGSVMCRPASAQYAPDGPPIFQYFVELIGAERAKPAGQRRSHAFDVFLEAVVEGRPLNDVQIAHQLQTMVLGGVHTTRGLLAHSVQRIVVEPEWWPRLRSDPDLTEVFVEESLRHDSPAPRVTRRCLSDTSVGGVPMRRGDVVEVGLASANRDEAVYDDVDEFRIDRPAPRDHVAFGGGPHVCPGAALARLEAVTALGALLDRLASIEPVAGHQYPPMPGNLGFAPILANLTPAG